MRKKAAFLFLLKFIKIPLNLFLLYITATYFGVSLEKDIWLLAFATMSVLDAAVWGPINETFRSRFIFLKDEDSEEYAIKQTQSLLTYFLLFSLLLSTIILIFPKPLAYFIAPQYTNTQITFLVEMIYWTVPVLLLNQMMQIGISILNAYEIFYVAELSGFVSTIGNIILIYLFAENFGIYSLAIAYYISTLILIAFIIAFIFKSKIPLFYGSWNLQFLGFKSFFLFALPFFLPYFFGQINALVEKILAGKLDEGTISILDFSNRIPNMMYGIVISVITTLLVPILSKSYIRGEKEVFNNEFQNMFRLGILIIGFICVFVFANASAIVSILYGGGSISASDLLQIASVTLAYSFALFGVFSYVIFGMSLLSSKNEKMYAFLGMLTQIGVIALNFILYRLVNIYIFPLSILVSHLVFSYLMFRKYPYKSDLKLKMLKYITLIASILGFIYLVKLYIVIANPYFSIISFTALICSLFIVMAYLLNLEEKASIFTLIKNRKNKR